MSSHSPFRIILNPLSVSFRGTYLPGIPVNCSATEKLCEGNVERVICRTVSGDLAILARHCNYCTALGMGEASVVMEDGSRRTAACIGGMLSVMNGKCRVLATTWEWKEDIDEQRAQEAKKRAEEMIAKGGLTDHDYKVAEAKLQRALVRLSVKS